MVADLQELSSLSKKLNAQSDKINSSIITINKKLANQNIGLRVWLDGWAQNTVSKSDWEPVNANQIGNYPRERTVIYLGYDYIADEWQLAVKQAIETESYEPEVGETVLELSSAEYQPLLKSSRATRISALAKVPRLLDAIQQRVLQVLQDIEAAEKAAEAL